jgi:two-component system cell cycle sensor histidine kinase/response regulator CckA
VKKYFLHPQVLTILIATLCGGIFILDFAIPQGYAGGVAHLFPMLLSSYYSNFRTVVAVATICISLTILGFSLSSIEAAIELVLMNRVLAIVVILICAWFINAQKKAEAIQARVKKEFQILWKTSTEGMITANSEGIITRMNSTVKKLFGYEQQKLVGQAVEVLIPKDQRKSHNQVRTAYQTDPYKREMGEGLELYGLNQDGSQFPLLMSLTPIEIDGVQEVLVEIQDISKRKIIEDKLRQSEKLSAIGQLTGGIAHDLNNILTAMVGFTELAQHRLTSDDESLSDLKQVLIGADRAKELISKMLAFSSQQVLKPKLCNINNEIVEMQEMLQQLINKSTKLILNLNPNLHLSYLDQGQFGQVIANIIVNASDAMPNGGTLVITTNNVELDEDSLIDYQIDNPGHYSELTISDSGVGIP